MRRSCLALALLAAGCSAPPAPVPVAPPAPLASSSAPPPHASASASAAASVVAPPAEAGRPAARVGAPIDGRFALAVDCKGTELAVYSLWSVGKDLLGICGMEVRSAGVFLVPPSGPARLAPEVFKDLPIGPEGADTRFGIFDVEGPDLEHLGAELSPLGSRTGVYYRFRRAGAAWKKTASVPFDGSDQCSSTCVEIDGKVVVEREDEQHRLSLVYEYAKGSWLPGKGRAPGCDADVAGFTFLRQRGKDLWGIGSACGKVAAQRWTVGTTATEVFPLGVDAPTPKPQVMWTAAISQFGETWVHFQMETRTVLRFDGKSWKVLGVVPGEFYPTTFMAAGKLWLWTPETLFRASGSQLEQVLVPEAHLEQVAASPSGEIRVWTGQKLYSLGDEDLWHLVPLPGKAGELHVLRHLAGRWSYWMEGAGGQLFIEGAAAPPLTIDSPEAAISPMGYVTPISRGCEAPFATLYKLGKNAPKDYDFPATRAALKGEAELTGARFSEVAALGDRYLVARYEGRTAIARLARLVKLVEKKVQGSKPQLLCADSVPGGLPVTRDVPMK